MKYVDGIWVKPLLHVNKNKLQEYLQSRSLEWREDISNKSKLYKRNKIRLVLIPILAEIAGSKEALQTRLTDLTEQSTDLRTWIRNEVYKISSSSITKQQLYFPYVLHAPYVLKM